MLVVWQLINAVATEVLQLTLQEPVIVCSVDILYVVLQMRDTPGSSTTATRLLCDSQRHALIERTTVERHLSCIRATGNTNVLHVNLSHFRAQQFQSVEQTAESPSPLAISTVILKLRIKTVKVMLSPFVMLTH